MMLDKYSKDGKVVGQVELADSVFNVKVNDVLIYELINTANANLRQGTHCTKERSFVSGGGAKPWRQKGTGRARQGSIRAPQWKGGGTIFGPLPRDYSRELPKTLKREAYRSLFSLKAKQGQIKVVEDVKVEEGKTKEMVLIGKSLSISKGVFLTENDDTLMKRSLKNIPWFVYNNVKRLSSRDIYYSKTLLITEGALKFLNEKYAKGE
jgi:large subunit ribosomal protein L4